MSALLAVRKLRIITVYTEKLSVCITGRNGETIRQMSRASKTKIYIDRTQDDYRDKPRVITISGAKPQIEIAKVHSVTKE